MSESVLRLIRDTRCARKQGAAAVEQRQRARLAEMVTYARAHSPYYRKLYQDLPEKVEDSRLLPVTSKKELIARFDDWVTDREVTLEKVRAFVDNPDLIGERFLGKYTVATTSGTTGTRGVFVLDDRTMAVTNALALRALGAWLDAVDVIRIIAGGGRMAMVMATGGHFASAVGAARLRRSRWGRKALQVLSVHMPMPELVARLNAFRPVIVAPYASTAALLATEQEAGRLHINAVLMALAAEGLPASEYDRIAKVFGTKVGNSYAATECPFLSYGCEHGWLHVNSDWLVLDPVDADYRPVPPGEQSQTVLICNLANRVQPILRYDLGDSVMQRSDPCPCGNPLPAIRVQGRSADVITFHSGRGEPVAIAPLAFGTLIDGTPMIDLFQIIQTTPTSLRVRLRPAAGADPDRVWQAVQGAITRLLAARQLAHVAVERAEEPPEPSPGGKYRTIIPLK
jgi:phenylacetate-coenzyme A ligase PaaK-like adenylate-forming protein